MYERPLSITEVDRPGTLEPSAAHVKRQYEVLSAMRVVPEQLTTIPPL